jgi:hypothetical protein
MAIAAVDHAIQPECTLNVEWDEVKTSHLYFPHFDGYTLVDTAALEPGTNFSMKMGLYFAGEGVTTPVKALFAKDSDLQVRHSTTAAHRIFCFQNGVQVCNEAVGAGYAIIEYKQGGTDAADNLVLLINGVEVEVDAAAAITNNAADWAFFSNGAGGAMEYVEYEVNQVTQVLHQIQGVPGHELEDHTGNGFDVIARYPDTVDDFTVSVGSVTPGDGMGSGVGAGSDVLGDHPGITNLSDADTSSDGGFFIFDIMSDVASTSGFPYQALVTFFALGATIAVALVVARIFKEALPVGISVVLLLVVFWQMGAIPGWMSILFSIGPLVFFLVWKKANP